MTDNGLGDRVRDTAGLSRYIIDGLVEVEHEFYDELVTAVAKRSRIDLSAGQRTLVLRRLHDGGINLRSGTVEDSVLDIITDTTRESAWAPKLDDFITLKALTVPFSQRRLALLALDRLHLTPHQDDVLLASVLADVSSGSGSDPAALTRPAGRVSPWDFQVDLFDTASAQIVLADNVRAAGALMWCYDIGERMGVYRLTDALVYRWWVGAVDFGDPDLTAELYRYFKMRDDRPSEEERALLYRRILNVGDMEVGHRAVINESFPDLWRNLMEEVALYIDRQESSFRDRVNRQSVEQAIQELQYNLTERMAGMALTTVTEMYNQLRQTDPGGGVLGGLDILGHDEVVAQLSSGRRRDEWSVIERLAKEEFNLCPNVSALRTSAVEGFKVVDYIATFTPDRLDQDRFDGFIASAKAWILAQKVGGSGLATGSPDPDQREDSSDDGMGELDESELETVGTDDDWDR